MVDTEEEESSFKGREKGLASNVSSLLSGWALTCLWGTQLCLHPSESGWVVWRWNLTSVQEIISVHTGLIKAKDVRGEKTSLAGWRVDSYMATFSLFRNWSSATGALDNPNSSLRSLLVTWVQGSGCKWKTRKMRL
jgi:hypothetical protein